MSTEHSDARSGEDATGANRPVPLPGAALTGGLVVCAAAMLAAATLGWAGVAILLGFLARGCTLLVRWSR